MLSRANAGEAAVNSDAIRRYVDDLTRLLAALDTEAIVKFGMTCSAYQEGGLCSSPATGAAPRPPATCVRHGQDRDGRQQRKRLRAVSLSDNVPLLTAWGNDSAYDDVFAEQLRNLARPGDCWSPSAAAANPKTWSTLVELAREMGLTTVGLLEDSTAEP